MNKKVWEFAVGPKDVAIIAFCMILSGLFLSGAGFVTGLLLAPRRNEVQARLAANGKMPTETPAPQNAPVAVATPAASAPVVKNPPETPEESSPGSLAVKAPEPVAKEVTAAPDRIESRLESAILAPVTTRPEAPAPLLPGILAPALAGVSAQAPAALTPAVATTVKPAPLPIRMAVQVGSFSLEENARNFVERLKRFGYPAVDLPDTDTRGRQWHVVQVGPYAAYDDASKTALELSTKYRLQPLIIPLTAF